MLLTERERLAGSNESPCVCGGILERLVGGGLGCASCGRTIMMHEHIVRSFGCLRCSHHWLPRVSGLPKKCPRCASYDWNKPYTYKKEGKPIPSRERKRRVLNCNKDNEGIHMGSKVRP
jgi:hypothetical protein